MTTENYSVKNNLECLPAGRHLLIPAAAALKKLGCVLACLSTLDVLPAHSGHAPFLRYLFPINEKKTGKMPRLGEEALQSCSER